MILAGEYEFDAPYWDPISHSAKDFIVHLLAVDAGVRWGCDEALAHAWVCGDAAHSTDIHRSVSTQLKQHFAAKKQWRKAINAQVALTRLMQHPPKEEEEGEGAD